MKQISFIHGADLHLDSPMAGLKSLQDSIFKKVQESTFTALKKMTDAAIKREVDFVILAGDLFDGEDRSLKAQSHLRNEMLRLKEHGIPVYALHGNHDHLAGSWVVLDLPDNVHIFSSEVETVSLRTKNGVKVHLYGFSYPERHVTSRKIADYRIVPGADYHIGVLHGNLEGNTEHGNYAPFTMKELLEKGFDYWALGHIHKRAILSDEPPIVYPGNIQGRNRKEQGEKGCYYVTMSGNETALEFIETSDIVWETIRLDVGSAEGFQEIYQRCQNAIDSLSQRGTGTLLEISLNNARFSDYRERMAADELQELLSESNAWESQDSFVYVTNVEINENLALNKKSLELEGQFFKELFETSSQYSAQQYKEALSPLYDHASARKYLSHFDDKEQQELLEKAENLLIKLLHQP